MKRYEWIDIAKGIGIILVVLAHTRFATVAVSQWINSFHMPLFFMMAGLCYDEKRYPSYLSYFKRKCAALLYPYVTLSLLVIALMNMLYLGDDSAFSSYSLLGKMCKGGTIGAFWFIWVLLEVELCYALIAKCVNHADGRLILCTISGVVGVSLAGTHLPYLLDIMLLALPFYGVGHYMQRFLLTSDLKIAWFLLPFGVIQFMVLRFAFPYTARFVANNLYVPYLFFMLAFAGTFFVSSLSMVIARLGQWRYGIFARNVFVFLGKNSIILLATHNALGICRASWITSYPILGSFWSQLIEFALLISLLFLLSGPMNSLVRISIAKREMKL